MPDKAQHMDVQSSMFSCTKYVNFISKSFISFLCFIATNLFIKDMQECFCGIKYVSSILTLKRQTKIAADDTLLFYFYLRK